MSNWQQKLEWAAFAILVAILALTIVIFGVILFASTAVLRLIN